MSEIRLSDTQLLVFAAVHDIEPCGPGSVGERVWGKPHRAPQAYARTAGKVLNALREMGLVERSVVHIGRTRSSGWMITARGEIHLRAAHSRLCRSVR